MIEGNITETTSILPMGIPPAYGTMGGANSVQDLLAGVDLQFQRMDPALRIEEALKDVASDKRILVAACGPRSLTDVIKDTTERIGKVSDCILDTHCEGFDG